MLITIDDTNYQKHLPGSTKIDGETKSHGLIPRNFESYPHGSLMFAKAFPFPLITDPKEQQERLDEQIAKKSRLIDIRNTSGPNGGPIPSRDQNGYGYCWAHSSTSAALLARAAMGEPYVDLSAFAVACIIKNYRDEGGNGIDSLQFIAKRGIPTSKYWPQKSTQRSNDNPDTWTNAGKHKFDKWADIDPQQMKDTLITCCLLNIPVVSDFNWWSHSVCTAALESINPFVTWIWNSWGDSWSSNGMGKLQGSKAIPDNGVAALTTEPSQD